MGRLKLKLLLILASWILITNLKTKNMLRKEIIFGFGILIGNRMHPVFILVVQVLSRRVQIGNTASCSQQRVVSHAQTSSKRFSSFGSVKQTKISSEDSLHWKPLHSVLPFVLPLQVHLRFTGLALQTPTRSWQPLEHWNHQDAALLL